MNVLVGIIVALAQVAQVESVTPTDYGPCGPVALYSVLRLRDVEDIELDKVRKAAGREDEQGRHSLLALSSAAEKLGYSAVAGRIDASSARDVPTPFIAQMKYSLTAMGAHYVTVLECSDEGVLVLDPPHRSMRITWDSFRDGFGGSVLCVALNKDEERGLSSLFPTSVEVTSLRTLAMVNAGGVVVVLLLLIGRMRWKGSGDSASMMRVRTVLLAGLCAAVAIVGVSIGDTLLGHAPARPGLIVKVRELDLGAIEPGDHSASFTVKNVSDEPIAIKDVVSTCSCTTANYPEMLKPHEAGEVKLSVHATPGVGGANVTVISGDGQPQYVSVHWICPQKPTLFPGAIVARDVERGAPFERAVAIRYLGYAGMKNHPAIALLTKPGDAEIKVLSVERPQKVADEILGGSGKHVLYEIQMQVQVLAPASAERIDSLAHLEIEHGTRKELVELPVAIEYR